MEVDSPRFLLKFIQHVLERSDLLPSSGLYQKSSSCCGICSLLLKCYVIIYLIVIVRKIPYFPPSFIQKHMQVIRENIFKVLVCMSLFKSLAIDIYSF